VDIGIAYFSVQPRSQHPGNTAGSCVFQVLSCASAALPLYTVQVKQLVSTVDSTISLLRNGGNFAVSSGGSTVTYFQNALDPVAAALASRCDGHLWTWKHGADHSVTADVPSSIAASGMCSICRLWDLFATQKGAAACCGSLCKHA
jgi:hypothetical protein